MGMRTILPVIPGYLLTLIQTLRARLRDANFQARQRVRPADFTRACPLTFPVLMLFVLQKSVKSIQRHLHEFLDDLAAGPHFDPLTSGAVTHARAKLKASAFSELKQACVLPVIYGPQHPSQRWRGHRLVGVDSSLVRLPRNAELGPKFGWKEVTNQNGAPGTRFPEARLSVLYDVLNRVGWEARLEPSTLGEVALASQQLARLQPGDVELHDRGFTGYVYLALVRQRGVHFIARCSTGSFLAVQAMFRRNRANQSQGVWLFAPVDQRAECRRLGLPGKLKVRLESLRLPHGELEVLATSLLDKVAYPTAEFLTVYHWRWGHETFYLMLKGRLELENFSGQTVAAVEQDVQAALLLANLESVLSEPAPAALDRPRPTATQARQVNRANSYHASKDQVLDLLYREIPVTTVIHKLMKLFAGSPVAARPERRVPRCPSPSLHRSYHFQRRVKKAVF
jgi:hypothetical protein